MKRTILGTTKDIEPSKPRPRLELSFSRDVALCLPRGSRADIRLTLDSCTWQGTVFNNTRRRPYLHTRLINEHGEERSCTEVFVAIGMADDGEIEFQVGADGSLTLLRVLTHGSWERRKTTVQSRACSTNPASQSTPTSAANRDDDNTHASCFPFQDRREILRLAKRYETLVPLAEIALEKSFTREMQVARADGFLSRNLFLRLGNWKSPRNNSRYESNSTIAIRRASAIAFTAKDPSDALIALTKLHGVAMRTASALLHWMRPAEFPIIDFRVMAALGELEPKSYEDMELYHRIAGRVKTIAKENHVDLRTIDRALWSWDKLRSRGHHNTPRCTQL